MNALSLFLRAKHPHRRHHTSGQHLAELAITLPLVLVLVLGVMELGRVWQVYNSARLAAMDGAYTATMTRAPATGETQMLARLTKAKITCTSCTVEPVMTVTNIPKGYMATATVQYTPIIGGITIPTLTGNIEFLQGFTLTATQNYFTSIAD